MIRTLLLLLGLALASVASAQTAPEPSSPAAPPVDAAADSTAFIPVPEPAVATTPADTGVAAPVNPNPRPTRTLKVRLIGDPRTVARAGPGDGYAIVGVYPKGLVFPVIAKNGPWYDLRLSDSESGWVHAALCQEFDDLSDLEFRPNPKLYTRTGSYVVTGYAGGYAFDRKSNSLVFGGRLGYYVFDRVTADVGLGYTHISRPREIVESLFGLTLEAEEFHMLFYNLNLTWEILPGRQMVPFVTGGVGSSIMQGEVEPSFNVGAGTTLFLSKRMATRWEVRGYRMHSGAGTSRVANDNIEFILGTQYLF
ncbi:MAG TPA: SH3 domain-containing protein [Candidatus Eisenbacteria bacterium]|nr:SH3 domain-containing protein [Candidatus Eisenbacteria bacterium]